MIQLGTLSDYGIDEKLLTEITKKLNASKKWLHDHYSEVQEQYSASFIAVQGEKVIENDSDREKLLKKLSNSFSNERLKEILIEYINPKGFTLIL